MLAGKHRPEFATALADFLVGDFLELTPGSSEASLVENRNQAICPPSLKLALRLASESVESNRERRMSAHGFLRCPHCRSSMVSRLARRLSNSSVSRS